MSGSPDKEKTGNEIKRLVIEEVKLFVGQGNDGVVDVGSLHLLHHVDFPKQVEILLLLLESDKAFLNSLQHVKCHFQSSLLNELVVLANLQQQVLLQSNVNFLLQNVLAALNHLRHFSCVLCSLSLEFQLFCSLVTVFVGLPSANQLSKTLVPFLLLELLELVVVADQDFILVLSPAVVGSRFELLNLDHVMVYALLVLLQDLVFLVVEVILFFINKLLKIFA